MLLLLKEKEQIFDWAHTVSAGKLLTASLFHVFLVIIYPLTTRVVWAPQMISQPVSSIFPCYPLPSGTCQNPGQFIP